MAIQTTMFNLISSKIQNNYNVQENVTIFNGDDESNKTTLVKVSAKNTSKTCHTCGYINPKVILGIEKWKCPVCSSEHDRDINAAKNILNKGVTSLGLVGRERAEIIKACGAPRSAAKQEVSNPSVESFDLLQDQKVSHF